MARCERCLERFGRIREGKEREFSQAVLCDDCLDAEAEAAHERFLENYYGSDQPVTLQEQYDAAAKQRRELRRLD